MARYPLSSWADVSAERGSDEMLRLRTQHPSDPHHSRTFCNAMGNREVSRLEPCCHHTIYPSVQLLSLQQLLQFQVEITYSVSIHPQVNI